MEKRKKYFTAGRMVLFIMLFAGFGLVTACDPCRGLGRHLNPGFHNKDFSKFILCRLDKRVEELNLSEAQKGKYKEIKGKLETRFKEHGDSRKRLIGEIQTEMKKEDPDVKVLSQSVKKQISRFPGFMEGNLDLFIEFYGNLDQEQKDRIMVTIRKKMKRCRVE